MICTDVAQRGLDFPNVDWILQYDAPQEPDEYIHRVGRTARGAEALGKALLFLMPHETQFLDYLMSKKVPITKFIFPMDSLKDIDMKFQGFLEQYPSLREEAEEAYKAFVRSYASRKMKDTFQVWKLDTKKMGLCFGLPNPPSIDVCKSLSLIYNIPENIEYLYIHSKNTYRRRCKRTWKRRRIWWFRWAWGERGFRVSGLLWWWWGWGVWPFRGLWRLWEFRGI